MQVLPAIDLLDGRVVRLRQGRYDQITHYDEDAAQLAERFREHVNALHVVDLVAARSGVSADTDTLRRVVGAFGDGVQVGGGVRSASRIEALLALGVSRVVMGTAAISDPALLAECARSFPGRVIVAVDARDGKVATDGWERTSDRSASELVAELSELPLAGFLYTDIERDGTEVGPNVEATARLAASTERPVLASGGVGSLAHLRALAAHPIHGAIVGRALHEGRFTLSDAVRAAQGE